MADRIIGCTCSDDQLFWVGCDCCMEDVPVMIVEFWPDGYANDRGLKRLKMHEGVDYKHQVFKSGWRSASIFSIRPSRPVVSVVTVEQARYYTKGDNS